MEVETVLNMLAVIDNPMQDIPLAGVLRSPIGGLTDHDLAVVMAEFKRCADKGQDPGFYGAVRHFLEAGAEAFAEDELYKKLEKFQKLIQILREEAGYLPVHRLIWRIFERTGYYDYVSAMPAGKARQANLDLSLIHISRASIRSFSRSSRDKSP